MADKTEGGSGFNPLLFLLIGGVFLVIINPSFRNALGDGAGFILDPIIGFGGQRPAVTLLLASLVTGTLTSLARHFMVDHVEVARVQETIRAFQKEFKKARKDENNYKVKRMTELQPKLMELQGQATGSQMKPMVATMLVVIPVFAWLATWVATPVAYQIDAPDDVMVLSYEDGLVNATVGAYSTARSLDFTLAAIPLSPEAGGATVTKLSDGTSVSVLPLENGTVLGSTFGARVQLDPGTWTVRADPGTEENEYTVAVVPPGGDEIQRYREAILLLNTTSGTMAVPVTEAGATLTLDAPADGRIVVPIRGEEPRGSVLVAFDGPGGQQIEVDAARHGFPLPAEAMTEAPPPHTMALPWNEHWDLQESWYGFLPHWIMIYSLYSIPIGQLVQKGLKGLQFSRELANAQGA